MNWYHIISRVASNSHIFQSPLSYKEISETFPGLLCCSTMLILPQVKL